ncbi:odorant receptor 9a-like isoform X2 [Microplitis mediator]|uniref:odorant receptor 9a-like isoform X2 n=1 Tax=Microplitis mediator TaxID=375433 RepID=UPI0025525C24|nr:odorant receptor 9a-like isoform X2 [Microplitis mediator]
MGRNINGKDKNILLSKSCIKEKILNVNDYEWAIGYHRKVLKLSGLWLSSESCKWYIKLLTDLQSIFIAICVITFHSTPQLMALIKIWGNLTLIVDNFLSLVPLIITQIKLMVLWTNRKAVAKIFDAIKSDWLELKTNFERQIMIKYARISKIMLICGLINIAYINNVTDIEECLIATQSALPFDVTIGCRCWIIRILYVVLCLLTGIVYTGIDMFFGMSVLHYCGQLEILAEKIKFIVNSGKSLTFEKLLKTAILRHYRLISLIEEIRNIFSAVLLLLVLCFVILFSVIGFLIVNSFGSNGTKVPVIQMNFYVGYISFYVGIMFLYSWVGENLVTKSEGIYLAVYSCNWTDLEPHQIAQLIIVLVRAQRPLEMTIGKFAPVSLNTFTQLLKTSMGYISVLLAKND